MNALTFPLIEWGKQFKAEWHTYTLLRFSVNYKHQLTPLNSKALLAICASTDSIPAVCLSIMAMNCFEHGAELLFKTRR